MSPGRGTDRNEGTGSPRKGGGPDLYLLYETLACLYFWAPVKFLLLTALVPLREVLLLEAAFQGASFLLEVPSGYLSDRWGRRPTLLMAALSRAGSAACFVVSGRFEVLLVAQLLLAAAFALRSGTDVSLHHGLLAELGREGEFEAREARAQRLGLLATAGASLLGGALGVWSLRLAFGAQALAALASGWVLLGIREPRREEGGDSGSFRESLVTCLGLLRQPALAWAVGAMVLAKLVDHLPYNFYQPYLALLGDSPAPLPLAPSLGAGVHVAATMGVGAWLTRWSLSGAARLGLGGLVLATLLGQLGMVLAMSTWLHPAVLVLVLFREAPNGLLQAPWRAAVVPRLPEEVRATFLSLQALLARLVLGAVLLGLTGTVGGGEPTSFSALARVLRGGAGVALLGWLLLLVAARAAPGNSR